MFSMPCFSVAVEDGQPAQEPRICSETTPEAPSKLLKMMSPPSPATAGRTRVSSNSLICETISASPSSKLSSLASSAAPSMSGASRVKCSMIAPRIDGFRCRQSLESVFVTEMKSLPKNTRDTSSMANSARARGERSPDSRVGKSATAASPITSRPGRNFSVAGFGVDSVWMNMRSLETYRGPSLVPFQYTLYMDPRDGRIKAISEVRRDAFPFPVPIARGFRAFGAVVFGCKRRLNRVGIADFRFRARPFTRSTDALGDLGFSGDFGHQFHTRDITALYHATSLRYERRFPKASRRP